MSKRGMFLLGMLALLFLANLAMLMGLTNWPIGAMSRYEGFANAVIAGKVQLGPGPVSGSHTGAGLKPPAGYMPRSPSKEQFMDMLTSDSGGFGTAPIGAYDGINLAANLPPAAQGFRQNHPNDPLVGAPIELDGDHLFLYANNRMSPECCPSTLSSDGGCVCTTPQQRDFINTRGGNRVHGGDF